ncbi:ubiquinol-cytochrome c reductase iron-sulfur subunit [Pelagibacterium lentulum]|uniref:Ubiquinol-cytochrome c reductase iron-sulfur subunit n=1 Tax=Pelagibacterium lentulum TaxID=2029865 RepID=A0A916W4C6_9HYPH|nr:ubiquinol-cytochrome c reductase iron-sulfur subunit [Pelagibacterium lentulum]GGA65209.1 ubiquinol-cytochrome c reductase iron-sulfur subunit [Pelagibacterium lentulum]
MHNSETDTGHFVQTSATRRDFLYVATGVMATVGTAAAFWPLIVSMRLSADIGAVATVEIDLSSIEAGQRVTIQWRGTPVFITHRTETLIEQARSDDTNPALIDPEPDNARTQRPAWLVVIRVCTHLGCIPLGQQDTDPRGPYGGWFCSCHGSIYDSAGRVRKGPAPRNLDVPPYAFLDELTIRIG